MSTIVVTRPDGQHEPLMELLREKGFQPLHSPSLQIEPRTLSPADVQKLINIDAYQAVFFASTNAVRFALSTLEDYWPQWPLGVHWLAVGDATARRLAQAGVPVESPQRGMDSEAVLELDCLKNIAGQTVLICRGDQGRHFLREQLELRGAEVHVLELYQRISVTGWQWPGADAVLVNSTQSWDAIAGAVPEPVLVVAASQRIAQVVAATHASVITADSALDADMVSALISHWRK